MASGSAFYDNVASGRALNYVINSGMASCYRMTLWWVSSHRVISESASCYGMTSEGGLLAICFFYVLRMGIQNLLQDIVFLIS